MPKMTKAIYNSESITIETALRLRDKTTKRKDRPAFRCDQCGQRVRAHKSGGYAAAHFEHFVANPECSQSDAR